MVAYGYRGIAVDGIGELASVLDGDASAVATSKRSVAALLTGRGEATAATEISASLSRVEIWAGEASADILWRRDTIARGQSAGPATAFGMRSLDPSLLATFAATVAYNPSARDDAYHDWLAQTYPGIAAAELRDVQSRIDNWSGTDNDPILDRLVRQAQAWRDALGINEDTMVNVAMAMEQGHTPNEAHLPPHLFPPEYLTGLRTYERTVARIEELEAEYWDLLEKGGDFLVSGLAEEYDATLEQRAAVEAELERTRDNLTEPSWDISSIHEYLLDNPFHNYIDQQRAAGEYLAETIRDAETLPELTTIADLLDEGGRLEAQSFFNRLGPAATASIPGLLGHAADRTTPGGEAATAMRAFSIALGEASRVGLDFSGSDLLPPFALDEDLPRLMEVNPAILFLYGTFDQDFIIDAALRPFEDEINFQLILDIGWPGHPLIESVDDAPNGQLIDFRVILLERVAELGPGAATEFITRATDQELLEVFLYPYNGLADGGSSAGAIIAQLASDTDNAHNVIAALAAGGPVDAGTAAGAELMFAPHLTALVQTQSPEGLATPISVLAGMDPNVLDAFLESIYRSGAGDELREQVNDLILYELTTTIDADATAARSAIIDFNEALGEIAGRVEGARHVAGEAMAKHADDVNAARAQITGMLLEAGIAVITPGGPLVGVAGGMAADVGVGAITDRLFPQDALQLFYESQYEELVGRSATAEQATIDLLDELGLIDKSAQPANTSSREYERWLDETMAAGYSIDDWVGTISEIYNKADKVRSAIEAGD